MSTIGLGFTLPLRRESKTQMHKVKTNEWAAYLVASEKAAEKKRRPFEVTDMTGACQFVFRFYACGAAAVIGWLLLFGWQ